MLLPPIHYRLRLVAAAKSLSTGSSSGGTFSLQGKLPRLPIPDLKLTGERYLKSTKPLLTEDEFKTTTAAVQAFVRPGGFGEVLQQRLIELDKTAKNSWLEHIWLSKAYLEWRDPSLINVNWWCQLKDPASGLDPTNSNGITEIQVKRASELISNMLNFKDLIYNEQLPPEMMKDAPLCMNQYRNLFAITRVPGEKADEIASDYPSRASHIIVLIRDQMYKIPVLASDGERLPISIIEKNLLAASEDSLKTKSQPAVGILTGGHRDTNFKGYTSLKSLSVNNSTNLETIRTALFVVCLDSHGGGTTDINETHLQIFHNFDGHNRWFDKALQLIVLPSGRAGFNGEHTPTDAVIPGIMMNYIVNEEPANDPAKAVTKAILCNVEKLEWDINEDIMNILAESQMTIDTLIADTQSVLLQTQIYGSQYIKDVAKSSPDAYIQVALQLAWRRQHQNPTAVYESASIRGFLHGRTETIRSLTVETWGFACAFDDSSISVDEKRQLFVAAIKSQSNLARDATFGRGIDRHLLALRTQIQSPEEHRRATLFTDPAFLKSMWFKLSTSNMSPGDAFYGGFGPVVPDGYGVNYAIGKKSLKFSMSRKISCQETDVVAFRDTLSSVLTDLQALFEHENE